MNRFLLVFAALSLVGCPYVGDRRYAEDIVDWDGDGEPGERFGGLDCRDFDPDIVRCDADEDGHRTVKAGGDDCDDQDATVHPEAAEVCDGADDDCDGAVDDQDDGLQGAGTYYPDDDGDDFGDPDRPRLACSLPIGYVEDDRDCDDGDPLVRPGGTEFCDPADGDCDGDPVGGAVDTEEWFADGDGDGWAPAGAVSLGRACEAPVGAASEDGEDCDDADDATHPGAAEIVADGVDQDCVGGDDADGDDDGYDAFVDCDDTRAEVHPGGDERCNGIDDDCDLQVDDADGSVSNAAVPWFVDADGDGRGAPETLKLYCLGTTPSGYVSNDDDCDDTFATVFLGAPEFCDDLDNDCNEAIDDNAVDRVTYFVDSDGDGHGSDLAPTLACDDDPGSGLSAFNDDCDDADEDTFPGATEVCGDSIRQDCSAFSPGDCDSDGYVAESLGGTDCDDTDPALRPGAREVCDGLDNDCDGRLDDADPDVDLSTIADWYRDADLDGYGDPDELELEQACAPQVGLAANNLDCDDGDPDVSPDAIEACNEVDDDCDGFADDADPDDVAVDPPVWFLDNDGDGFGDPQIRWAQSCLPPAGVWSLDGTDCQPGLAAVNPWATEICDGLDNDCDDLVDDTDPGARLDQWYLDNDGDGWGQSSDAVAGCGQPAGRVAASGDCNDFEATANPGAEEVCDNGIDNDCDTFADDLDPDLLAATTWYGDGDADGYGDPDRVAIQCTAPVGHVANNQDCDDAVATVNPAAAELCNALDDDCDTLTDESDPGLVNAPLWFADVDRDGWGSDLDSVRSCDPPAGYRPSSGDCDDADAGTYPNAPEVCDASDNDCDLLVDDSDVDVEGTIWYLDLDGDLVGGPVAAVRCAPVPNALTTGGDCADGDPTVYPGATERCDGRDDDCDALVDDADPSVTRGPSDLAWPDADHDGFGASSGEVAACAPPTGFASNDLDCDDADIERRPGATELCNTVDDDCDGAVDALDPSLADGRVLYPDLDTDGWGGTPAVKVCGSPAGYVAIGGDCADGDAAVSPSADEVCNAVDDDCDQDVDDADADLQGTLWYADADGDLFGGPLVVAVGCVDPGGNAVDAGGDCNDADPVAFPGGTEICGGSDEDCDGLVDDADPTVNFFAVDRAFTDLDQDGYGDGATGVAQCVPRRGQVSNGADCADTDPARHPGAAEVCNTLDDDCDLFVDSADPSLQGAPSWYPDLDHDGFGGALAVAACTAPADHVGVPGDCQDANGLVHPGSPELCNGADDDCDLLADDADPDPHGTFWYRDADQDGFGTTQQVARQCADPGGFTADVTGDCADTDGSVSPGALEVCNGVDDDCDTLRDDQDSPVGGTTTFFVDSDLDGVGGAGTAQRCQLAVGLSALSTDCVDSNPAVFPGAAEVCDGIDNDCDLDVDAADPNVTGATWVFVDADRDGWGALQPPTLSCTLGAGFSLVTGDCRDDDDLVSPSVPEICNGDDDDCDGAVDGVDPGLQGGVPSYLDLDGDTYGDPTTARNACPGTPGFVTVAGDCDDTTALASPDKTEQCSTPGLDDDCNGLVDAADPFAQGVVQAWSDLDGDGWGAGAAGPACTLSPGKVAVTSKADCKDNDLGVYPGATEVCNSKDDDCDGQTDTGANLVGRLLYADTDLDGFGDPLNPRTNQCNASVGVVEDATDCNDGKGDLYPGQELTVGPGSTYTLAEAVGGACDDGVITVLPGVPALQSTIAFNGRRLTLRGPSATSPTELTAAFRPMVSVVAGDPAGILLENLMLTNSTVGGTQAAIRVQSNELELRNVTVRDVDGYGTADGAAVRVDGGLLICDGCSFLRNQGRQGGAIGAAASQILLYDTVFEDNEASLNGATITGFDSDVWVFGGEMVGNTSPAHGTDAGLLAFNGTLQMFDTFLTANHRFNARNASDVVLDGIVGVDTEDFYLDGTVSQLKLDLRRSSFLRVGRPPSGGSITALGQVVGSVGNTTIADPPAGGIAGDTPTLLALRNVTFAGGAATQLSTLGGGSADSCVFWAPFQAGGELSHPPGFAVDYSLFSSAAVAAAHGATNLAAPDPGFQTFATTLPSDRWDLRPRLGGTLVDQGNPAAIYDDVDGTRNDLGATGGSQGEVWYEDTDLDGLGDGWELENFGTLAFDGASDPDADFLANAIEHVAGTSPMSADTDGDGGVDGFDQAPLDPLVGGG